MLRAICFSAIYLGMHSPTLVTVDTEYGHYEVTDTTYSDRPARVLYSGAHQAAQSGIAFDDKPELLFDYNERFMELCRGLLPKKILLLGGGACTLPKALLEEFPDIKLDIVELDGKLFEIAKEYFDFVPSPSTRLHISDAEEFLSKSKDTYDLILLDVFTHAAIPRSLQTAGVTQELAAHITSEGVVAMNIIAAYTGIHSQPLHLQTESFMRIFKSVELFPASYGQSLWLSQNFIMTASNKGSVANLMRYKSLELPGTSQTDLV